MKYRRQSNVNSKLIIAIVIAVLAVALIGFIIFSLVNAKIQEEKEKQPYAIVVSYNPNPIYYVGEKFDPKGIEVQVTTNNMDNTYIVDYTELRFEGFDSSAPNDNLKVKVIYGELSTEMTIIIKEYSSSSSSSSSSEVTLKKIEVISCQTKYTLADWNDGINWQESKIKLIYSDNTTEEKDLEQNNFKGWKKLTEAGTIDITIQYKSGDILKKQTVTITVTD